VQLLYYLGVMQWIIKHFAWFFFKTMNVSGAEAVVAAASPFIGLGESACLVRPYVEIMTESELHLVMTSGKSPSFEFDDGQGLNQTCLRIFYYFWLGLGRIH
jgi:concentrative nucleoside transporter, CNT family